MTKLDELIAELESDANAERLMGDLLGELRAAKEALHDSDDEEAAERIATELLRKHMENAAADRTSSRNSTDIESSVDLAYMEDTCRQVEEAFASEGWKNYQKHSRRADLMKYQLGFTISNTTLRVVIVVEDVPKRIRIYVTIPIAGEKTYEYLLSKAIVDANKRFIYGAFQYDQDDGELTYEYSYPVTHGFYQDDFIRIVRAILHTAVDDEAYPAIKKAAHGHYKRAEREEILRKLAPLVEDLTDE